MASTNGFVRSASGRYTFEHEVPNIGRHEYAVERSTSYGGWLLFRVTPESRYGDGWLVAVNGERGFAPRYASRIRPRVWTTATAAITFARGLMAAETVGAWIASVGATPAKPAEEDELTVADSVKVTREDFARSSGLAPLVTRAQLETIDKLAEASEVLARVPVSVDVVPDVTAEGFERGAVLVLLTPDDDGAPEPVRSVWSATGASRMPVPEVGGENAYARALAFIRADGSRPITERTSTSTFRVLPGGSYSRRQF